MNTRRLFYALLLFFVTSFTSQAQNYLSQPIVTAVPFLNYTPDARGSALGYSGVATSTDAFSMFYNPAKYAFMQNEHTMIASGFNLFYSNVSPTPYMLFDAFAQKIGNSAIAASVRYYKSADYEVYDAYHQLIGYYRPREFAVDLAYSYRFGDYLSAGVAARFIHSNLNTGMPEFNAKSSAFAGDVSVYYKRPLGSLVDMSLGAAITNIGTKMAYYNSADNHRDFLPTTLRLGTGFKFNFHPKNTLAVNLEFSKLMVPEAPIRDKDGNILYGYDNNVSVFRGLFQSFYDAPGYAINNAFSDYERVGKFYEELCEINTGIGLEYNLADHFFARTGFYHSPYLKGGVNCLTEGVGMRFGIFGMDLSYSYYISSAGVVNYIPVRSLLRWDMYFAF